MTFEELVQGVTELRRYQRAYVRAVKPSARARRLLACAKAWEMAIDRRLEDLGARLDEPVEQHELFKP